MQHGEADHFRGGGNQQVRAARSSMLAAFRQLSLYRRCPLLDQRRKVLQRHPVDWGLPDRTVPVVGAAGRESDLEQGDGRDPRVPARFDWTRSPGPNCCRGGPGPTCQPASRSRPRPRHDFRVTQIPPVPEQARLPLPFSIPRSSPQIADSLWNRDVPPTVMVFFQ